MCAISVCDERHDLLYPIGAKEKIEVGVMGYLIVYAKIECWKCKELVLLMHVGLACKLWHYVRVNGSVGIGVASGGSG